MDFPATIPVARINAKHRDWTANIDYWERLRQLSEGGKTMDLFAMDFLRKRPMEPTDVYADRVAAFCYTNHLGNITGWYSSALFKQAPSVVIRSQGPTPTIIQDGPQLDKLNQFVDNCDRNGNKLVDFWQKCVQPSLLLYRKCYILLDLPVAPEYISRAAQDEAGALVPHLVAYNPQDFINWQVDESGELEWAILKLRATTQDTPFADVTVADRWYIFTADQVAAYEYQFPQKDTGNPELGFSENDYNSNAKAELLAGYPKPHSLADEKRVPIFVESIHKDHWIGDRVVSPLVRLLNLENSHDWSLEQSNLAQLVIYSDQDLNAVKRGEAHFLQLGSGDKAEYLEPSGQTTKASQDRINEVREEIYRLAYLVAQGRSASASAAMQSGYSKEQDMMPARDVLAALGDGVRGAMEKILQTAADRMGLQVDVDVQGFDFSDRSDVIELEVMEKADATTPINSATYEREKQKRVVRIAMPDLNRETLQAIDKEIDAAPTPSEQQQQQQEQAVSMRLSQQMRAQTPRLAEDAVQAA